MSDMTLYNITDTLPALLDTLDMVAVGSPEETEIKAEIAKYMQALPTKVDSVAHVIRTLESQVAFAKEEIERLQQRKSRFEKAKDRLKEYVKDVLLLLPEPKKGSRKLEGRAATLALKGNGGLQSLEIYNPSLIPQEFCIFRGWMSAEAFEAIPAQVRGRQDFIFTPEAHQGKIRTELGYSCSECGGRGYIVFDGDNDRSCDVCGGDGKRHVPGARLCDRGSHVEVK